MRIVPATLLLAALACPATALAQIQTRGAESFPGRNELSVQLGYQSGFYGNIGNPSGFKLLGEYAHGFSDLVWFDLQVNQVFGMGSSGTCFTRFGQPYPCRFDDVGGWATEVAAGIKLKIKTGIPLVFEIPITGAVEFLYNRACNDGGVAIPVFRPGARLMYFLTRNIGIGGGFNLAIGPAFHGDNCNGGSYTDIYGAFDGAVGAEFIL
jgi:hypothetical protein